MRCTPDGRGRRASSPRNRLGIVASTICSLDGVALRSLPVRDHELRTGRRADPVVALYLAMPLELLPASLAFVVTRLSAGRPRAGPLDHLVLGQFRVPQQTHRAPPQPIWRADVPT